jgi:hypothetical protein
MPDALRVVYVVGSSHSGSTLLALLADEHPEVASIGETAVKPRIRREGRATQQPCSCGALLQDCAFWRRIFAAMATRGGEGDVSRWGHDYRFDNRWLDLLLTRETSQPGLLAAREIVCQHLPMYRRRLARIHRANVALIGAVLSQTGKRIFLDSTKLLTRLTFLLAIPELDVKIVRLVRDARGFAASAKRRGLSIDRAARVWRNDQVAISRALSRLPADRSMMIRYEDLCTRPHETLDALWAFCGVRPFTPPVTVRSSDHHIIGNRMRTAGQITIRLDESWRTRLNLDEHDHVLGVAGSINRAMGYA